mgnify:CR=1 FL=1
MKVPWTEPQGRFTRLFERFAVEVLLASASVSQGCELLGIGWETAHEIMRRLPPDAQQLAPLACLLYTSPSPRDS